jgi:hypothetical protein
MNVASLQTQKLVTNAENTSLRPILNDLISIVTEANSTPIYTPAYKVYTALLTQTGASAPIATILENTLGFTPVWETDSAGWFKTNSTFFTDKTVVFLGAPYPNSNPTVITLAGGRSPSSGGSVIIQSRENGALADNIFSNTPIEIRVYN